MPSCVSDVPCLDSITSASSRDAVGEPAADAMPMRVVVAHACPIVRAGVAAVLAPHTAFVISDDPHWSPHCNEPAIIVTDYLTGLAVLRHAWPKHPCHVPQVLMLTNHDKEGEVQLAVQYGVNGYLLHGCSPDELVHCVQLLHRGVRYLSALATRSMADALGRVALTRRENDVLQVLADGGSDKIIARELGIGASTVKFHVKNVLDKLDATARTQAVMVAIERGLLPERGLHAVAAGRAGDSRHFSSLDRRT